MTENKKFSKKSYLTSFTGFAPEWDAEIGRYIIDAQNLLFVRAATFAETKVRRNKTTGEKIVIFVIRDNDEYEHLVLQPKDFIVVDGGIAVKDNAYMKNKLSKLPFTKFASLQFLGTGFQLMWGLDKEENK